MNTTNIQRSELAIFNESLSKLFSEMRSTPFSGCEWNAKGTPSAPQDGSDYTASRSAKYMTELGVATIASELEESSQAISEYATRSRTWTGSIEIHLLNGAALLALQNTELRRPYNGPEMVSGKTGSVHIMENGDKSPALNRSQIAALAHKFNWAGALDSIRLELHNDEGPCPDALVTKLIG